MLKVTFVSVMEIDEVFDLPTPVPAPAITIPTHAENGAPMETAEVFSLILLLLGLIIFKEDEFMLSRHFDLDRYYDLCSRKPENQEAVVP